MVVYGRANQADLVSEFAGRQCTSMSLACVIFWYCQNYCRAFTPSDINKILVEGNRLHTYLRKSNRFNRFHDGMVGISDLPHQSSLHFSGLFRRQLGVRLAEESIPVFTSEIGTVAGLQSLQQYIESHKPDSPDVGFLVTIKYFTYAIIRSSRIYHIFDSHGNLRLNGRFVVGRGMVITFPDLSSLIGMLQGMFGLFTQCDIAPVACQDLDCRPVTSKTNKMCHGLRTSSSTKFVKDKTNESTAAENLEYINDLDDDSSPYVSMMGGW
ncbi:hypothetical protein ACF0H5_015768 [Mactra antiquata]